MKTPSDFAMHIVAAIATIIGATLMFSTITVLLIAFVALEFPSWGVVRAVVTVWAVVAISGIVGGKDK